MTISQLIDETFMGHITNQQCVVALRQRMQALAAPTPTGLTEAQFEAAFNEHGDYIRRVLSGCPPEMIEDLAQDVWMKAWEKRSQFRGQASVRTWVSNIARNILIDYVRRNSGTPILLPLPSGASDEAQEDEFATTPSEAPAIDLRHDLAIMLDPEDRKLLEMLESGESGKYMATALGITVKACESRAIRLRKRIQKYIQEGCRNDHV
jgi:RNA polymerase sigma-70 factor, ECF subfamily